MKRITFGLIVLAVGVMMLLRAMGVASFDCFFSIQWGKYIPAVVVIIVGLSIISRRSGVRSTNLTPKDVSDTIGENGMMDVNVLFSGHHYKVGAVPFRGAQISCLMGGVVLDLSQAELDAVSSVKVKVLMAGVQVILPADVQLEISSSCFMGGVDNKLRQPVGSNSKTIRLNAECFMGGVEIKTID